MAKIGIYLNFTDYTEEVFNFYKSVFGGEFAGDGISRFGDMPPMEGHPPLTEAQKRLVMHVELPIYEGYSIMGSDAPDFMGFSVNIGNNTYVSIEPRNKAEADRWFNALADGGQITMPLQETFWGAYFGSCTDKYGTQWMFNLPN